MLEGPPIYIEHERRLSSVEGSLEHLATKADLSKMETRLVKWFAGTVIVGLASIAAILRYLAP